MGDRARFGEETGEGARTPSRLSSDALAEFVVRKVGPLRPKRTVGVLTAAAGHPRWFAPSCQDNAFAGQLRSCRVLTSRLRTYAHAAGTGNARGWARSEVTCGNRGSV